MAERGLPSSAYRAGTGAAALGQWARSLRVPCFGGRLLSENSWRGASLGEVVRRELAPYARGNTETTGPRVTLTAEATQAIAAVLHELTTNAAKYGALSNRSGRVSVRWRWSQNGSHDRLLIEWQETGGPSVVASSRSSQAVRTLLRVDARILGYEKTAVRKCSRHLIMSSRKVVIDGVTYIRSRDAARAVNLHADYVSSPARRGSVEG